ncbi:NAD(P)H-dependent glycerol-3-phosphate dehydrogenase [Rivihabitans pingtungensis]|jgi:glycerol-3-phosphate dehydrogenase (NAD(P)+)|uniref:NAD(P)H-dependent glycerol-3-phosphate dehydrogenase n=1 Tax=Rivihabitans pingtungensis TaxID=1054498 RepID=UPI002FD97A4A
MKLSIFGAGAWGTALAVALAREHEVTLWARDAALIEALAASRRNTRYLPEAELPANLALTADFAAAAHAGELALVVTPIAGLRATLRRLHEVCGQALPPVLWACKGFEAGSGLLPHEVAAQELPADAVCGALSGPSFAQEVAAGLPSAIALALNHGGEARRLARALHTRCLRIYANQDLVGVEVGGAVKNVMAIAAGVADGLHCGHNARAALLTRGLAEISRLAQALGGQAATLMGLSGLGDLILTCTGNLSRNRRVGMLLAEGRSLDDVLASLGHVAEGVPTARETLARARALGVDMPITAGVCAMLFGQASPQQVVDTLLERAPKAEDGSELG